MSKRKGKEMPEPEEEVQEEDPEDKEAEPQAKEAPPHVELFTVGNALDSLQATVSCGISWQAARSDTINGTVPNSNSRGGSSVYSSATGSPRLANQQKIYRLDLAGAASVTLDLVVASANVCGDATATLSMIYGLHIKLLSPTSAPGLVTAVCDGIKVAPGATTPFDLGLTGTTPAITLLSDDEHLFKWNAGKVVSASLKSVTVTNLDATDHAIFEFAITGLA